MLLQNKEEQQCAFSATSAIIVLFLFSLGVGVFFFAFPLFAFHNSWSGGRLGLVFSGYFFARLLASPLAGTIADRYNSKKLLLASLFLTTIPVIFYFFLPGQTTLFTIQFGLGLGSGIVKPVVLANLAANTAESKQGKVFGWSSAANNLVFFLGPAVGGLLYYYLQMELVLGFVLGCMLSATLIVHKLFPAGTTKTTSSPFSLVKHQKKLTSNTTVDSSNKPLQKIYIPFQFALMIAIFGRTLGIAVLLVFFPILVSQKTGGADWLTGLLVALPGGASSLLLPLTGKLSTSSTNTRLILGGMLTSTTALVLTGLSNSLTTFVITGILMGIGTAISLPASMIQATESSINKGRAMGVFQMAASAGFLVGPILCGLLIQWTASAAIGLISIGLLGLLLCFPLIMCLPQQRGLYNLIFIILFTTLLSISFTNRKQIGKNLPHAATIQQKSKPQQEREQSSVTQEIKTFANLAMGGIVHLKMVGAENKAATIAAKSAFATMTTLEQDFGHRSSTGSIGKINRAAGDTPVVVSTPSFSLIKRALDLGKRSSGIFDITIGAVTVLPFYYREKAADNKAKLVDYKRVILNEAKQTVFLPEKGMALDLGGLAKGSIVDAAAEEIKKAGVPAALIEASGDFYCYGERIWRVGIQDPRGDGLLGVIEVKNAGVCGSGDYYQYDIGSDDGKRKHHILDPKKLTSADKSIAVTVIAPTTELADALATTLFIMGYKEGREFLKLFPHCSALWVLPNQEIILSDDFPELTALSN